MDVLNQPKSFNFQKDILALMAFNSQWFQTHSWLHYEEVNCANVLYNIYCETAHI